MPGGWLRRISPAVGVEDGAKLAVEVLTLSLSPLTRRNVNVARDHLAEKMGSMLQVRTFHGHDSPMVEVLVDEVWFEGFLRAWRQHDDESWTAQVSWSRGVGESSRLDVFVASDVRKVDEEQWLRGYFARRAAEGNPVPEHLTGNLGPMPDQ